LAGMKHLLYTVLALGALTNCSKKDDPATPVTPSPAAATASYTLDGRATVGAGKVYLYPAGSNNPTTDNMVIVIDPTTPGATTEDVVLSFSKPKGGAVSQYKLYNIGVDTPNGLGVAGTYTYQATGTVVPASSSTWSGTFAGNQATSANVIKHTIKDGVFTELPQ
jgi:hypothetical protein